MSKKFVFVALIVLLAIPLGLAQAQEPTTGSGDAIKEGNLGGSTNLCGFNPLVCNDTGTARINALIYPTLVGASPFTQTFAKMGEEGVSGALATDWTINEDGTVYTFKLVQNAKWTDGTPITAKDVKFSFDAIASGLIDAPTYGLINYVPQGNESGIKEIRIIDDYTVEVEYGVASCRALPNAGFVVVPSQVFGYDGSPDFDFTVVKDHEFNTNPSVAYGPMQFSSFNPGEAIGLVPVENWAEGVVVPAGFIYRDVPDQNILTEQFLAGEANFIDGPPPSRTADVRNLAGVQEATFPGNSWDYVMLNLADPENPQPGLDADGNPIDQGFHPMFGDVRVRRALQMAINIPDIVEGAFFGEGTQMSSYLLPTSWAHDPNLAPVPYDPAAAAALLDEAGWPAGSDGQRTCQGCLYAKEGTPFQFELVTNSGNVRREAIGTIIQDQLAELGITVDFQAIDFNTMLDMTFGAQTFDAAVMGWRQGFPDDPDATQLFTPSNDDPSNQGSDGMSYNNPEVTRLVQEALTVPACDEAKRAEIYHQIEKILQDDQPYIWIATRNTTYAALGTVQGFDPQPNVPMWNANVWNIAEK